MLEYPRVSHGCLKLELSALGAQKGLFGQVNEKGRHGGGGLPILILPLRNLRVLWVIRIPAHFQFLGLPHQIATNKVD